MKLSEVAARGALWLSTVAGANLMLALAAQIGLGWLLSDEEFGIYALALGFSITFHVFREAGIRRYLSRLDRDQFAEVASQAFWLGVMTSTGATTLLIALIPVANAMYGESSLGPVLLVIALSLPLGAYSWVGFARLQVDLRFADLARIEGASAVIRYTLMLIFAATGFGPLSFVLPMLVTNTFDSAATWAATRLPLWKAEFSRSATAALLKQTIWPLLGGIGNHLYARAAYFTMGLVLAAPMVGLYFFAFQLTWQLVILVTTALNKVLLPTIARITDDRARLASAFHRSAQVIAWGAAMLFGGLAATVQPLTDLLWNGKWAGAVSSIQLLSLVLTIQVLAYLAEIVLQAQGRFRLWAGIGFAQGVGVGATALVGSVVWGDGGVGGVTAAIVGFIALSSIFELALLGPIIGYSPRRLARDVLPAIAYALGSLGLTIALSWWIDPGSDFATLALRAATFGTLAVLGSLTFLRENVHVVRDALQARSDESGPEVRE